MRIEGRTATVTVRSVASRNDFGEPVCETEDAEVENVLVVPGATADLDATRPEGVRVALTLHWPKTALGVALRGAEVTLSGEYAGTYRVVGDPRPYQPELCPLPWCMPVEVEAVDG